MNDSAILEIVKEGFEEQKGVKILSLYFSEDDYIYGTYIIPPSQSLSFLQLPLLDMATDLDKYTIILVELGELLRNSYRHGIIEYFNWLLVKSEIDCSNELFDKIVAICRENPPLLLMKANFIKWIELTDDISPMRTKTFIKTCEIFNKVDKIEYNVDLDFNNAASIHNQFNYVKEQLKEKKYKKINELTMNEIDKLFIQMQIDLYMTDNK